MKQAAAIRTYQLGLLGFPLGHSLSPALHRAALRAAGLAGDYSLFPVALDDRKGLAAVIDRVRSRELAGLNVTIPHKQRVISLLDQLSPTAEAIGAVNTIYMEGDKLIGDNTDAPAFLLDQKAVLAAGPSAAPEGESRVVTHGSSIILGAGGSASAVVYALAQEGWDVTVMARRLEQAQAISERIEGVRALALTAANLRVASPSLIVNTTPVGMTPHIDASPWPEGVSFPADACVYDLVYNPRETRLVREAHAAGLLAASGLGMLVGQAALAFQRWTGHQIAVGILREAIE